MRNFGHAMTLGIAAALLLSACHPRHDHHDDDVIVIPPGGVDFGSLDHFDHAYDEQAISSSNDADGYEFRIVRSSVVVITAVGTGGLDAYLDLHDLNFGYLGGDDNGGPGSDPVIVAQLDVGDYLVVIGSSDGSTGDYAIDISVEPLGGADLGLMAVPDSILDTGGSITDQFDVDSYIFTIYDAAFADIFLTRTSGNYDGNLELLDEYGNVLTFVDPAGLSDPDILGIDLPPGTYIIRVGATAGSGDYDLQLDTY